MTLGFDSTAWTGFVEAWFVWMLTFLDLDGGGRTLDFPKGRVPLLLLGMEMEGEGEWEEWKGNGRWGGGGNF